jgi:hypothetical protein
LVQTERGVDQPDVAIGLREVAEHSAGDGIELLGQQSDVVAAREQTLKQPSRIFVSILQKIVVDQPKAASQESALAGGKPIDAVLGFVPQDKLILDQEPLLNRFESSADPTTRSLHGPMLIRPLMRNRNVSANFMGLA